MPERECWTAPRDAVLEVTTAGANVQFSAKDSFRLTMSPNQARRIAAVLLAKADEAARQAVEEPEAPGP